jgi:hypothetical protein
MPMRMIAAVSMVLVYHSPTIFARNFETFWRVAGVAFYHPNLAPDPQAAVAKEPFSTRPVRSIPRM